EVPDRVHRQGAHLAALAELEVADLRVVLHVAERAHGEAQVGEGARVDALAHALRRTGDQGEGLLVERVEVRLAARPRGGLGRGLVLLLGHGGEMVRPRGRAFQPRRARTQGRPASRGRAGYAGRAPV